MCIMTKLAIQLPRAATSLTSNALTMHLSRCCRKFRRNHFASWEHVLYRGVTLPMLEYYGFRDSYDSQTLTDRL